MIRFVHARRGATPARSRGQIIVLFALALAALFAMAGLLLDGAHALTLRRKLQDAGDAGALAAANLIQTSPKGCASGGTPRTALVTAAQDAVHASMPGIPNSAISVTCPAGQDNWVVQVDVLDHSPGFFGGVVGIHGYDVRTTSQALNGSKTSVKYSVVELDPSNLGWPNGQRGCPSVLFSGSNTVIFDGSLQVNSACAAGNGGALGTNGNSAVVQVNNGSIISLVGGYQPGALTISPAPLTGQPALKDPLRNLVAVPYSSWGASLTRASSQTVLSGGATVLLPGIYVGGILMKNSAIAYLQPGIYVMKDATNGDGGLQIGSQNKVYSIPSTATSTTDATWATDCTTTNCGVLIYNAEMACASGSPKDQVSVGAGATLKLRPYNHSVDGTNTNDATYDNLLLWQDKTPVPTASCVQPPIALSGGGQMNISGTLYAPNAAVQMSGNSGGAGGSSVDITLQFISWDLSFNGNIGFHFFYQSDAFARPTEYGLIK
jgi:Flp pilus assembly protein TadG